MAHQLLAEHVLHASHARLRVFVHHETLTYEGCILRVLLANNSTTAGRRDSVKSGDTGAGQESGHIQNDSGSACVLTGNIGPIARTENRTMKSG